MAEDTEHPSPSPSEDDPGEQLPLVELETILNQPPSQRKRLVQIGLGLAVLVVVFATFWGVIRPKAPPVAARHAVPTEPPPTLLITSNVNYGTITINGQKQRGAPPLEVKMHTQPPYQITLDAPPFQSFTCTFPGCAVDNIGLDPSNQAVRSASLTLSAASLPLDQRNQVNSLVSQAISVQQEVTVPAGASIAIDLAPDGTISSQQATEPLQATALLVPMTTPNQNGFSCTGVICVSSLGGQTFNPSSASSGHLWQIGSFAVLRWRFTTTDGAVVGEVTYPVSEEIPITLAYNAATGWQIAPQSSGQFLQNQLASAVCQTGAEMLQVQQARYLSGVGWNVSTLSQRGLVGCEYQLMYNNANQGVFVWRFGVLLAADPTAHNTLPTLPIASPKDIAAVGG
jgi:hypothetical protein